MNAIVDTGFLVALMEVRDAHHRWAMDVAGQIKWPALTCESVLSETAFHVRSSETPIRMLRDGILQLAFEIPTELEHLHDLAERYADRHPDLADLCLIRLSELYPRHMVVTTDEEDFRVYRRNKREAIPLLCPPKK